MGGERYEPVRGIVEASSAGEPGFMNTTPELWTAPSGERPWRTAYQRFRELERWLTDEHPSGRVPCAAPRRGRRATRFRSQGIARLRSSYDQNAPGFVFEDVYHLAFHQIMSWRSYGAPILPAADYFRLYRGQRKDTWEVGAKIYRGPPVPARSATPSHGV